MTNLNRSITRARSLRADILAAPQIWLPRREVLVQWLDGFLLRSDVTAYELGETEEDDLGALDQFLRSQHIPAA